MKKLGTFVLRKVMDEYVLIPCKKTAEEVNEIITLSETAAFIYEHAEEAGTSQKLAAMLGEKYGISAQEVHDDVKMVLKQLTQMKLIEKA